MKQDIDEITGLPAAPHIPAFMVVRGPYAYAIYKTKALARAHIHWFLPRELRKDAEVIPT